MSEWYYGKTGAPEGPVDDATLRERIAAGQLTAESLVWKRGMAEWQPLSTFPDLLSLVVSPTIAPATQSVSPPVPPASTDALFPQTPYAAGIRRTSGLAIASLVCGLMGFITCFITAIPAVICGHLAMREIKREPQAMDGRGMALAGLIIGYLILGGTVLYILFFAVMVGIGINSVP